MLREVAETETDKKLRFKIVEKGGKTIERSLMRPNPTGDSQCNKPKCPVCPMEAHCATNTTSATNTNAMFVKRTSSTLARRAGTSSVEEWSTAAFTRRSRPRAFSTTIR